MSIWKAIIAAWSSRKLWAFLITVAVLWFGWERVIWHLYALPVEKSAALVTLSNVVFGIIGCAAGAYMGFSSWAGRVNSDSVASAISETITKTVRAPKAEHFDDGGEDLD